MVGKKRVSDFASYEDNPSIRDMVGLRHVAKRERKKEDALVTNKATGNSRDAEVETEEEVYEFSGWDWLDAGNFTKLFKGAEKEIRGLGAPSIDVLMFIIENLKNGHDVVHLDTAACMEALGYKSRSSLYIGILGLLEAGFIYRKACLESYYFVNVNKIFKGKRAKLKEREDGK